MFFESKKAKAASAGVPQVAPARSRTGGSSAAPPPGSKARDDVSVAPAPREQPQNERISSVQPAAPQREELVDVEIPLEMDLDGDPTYEDEVRLRRLDGRLAYPLRGDSRNVRREGEAPLQVFHFQNVPAGEYALEVRIGAAWTVVIARQRISPDGVFVGDAAAQGEVEAAALGKPTPEQVQEEPEKQTDPHVDAQAFDELAGEDF